MGNKWKVAAIIFMVLFIAETLFIGWAWNEGNDYVQKDTECAYDICYLYDSYYYDGLHGICSCFKDNEIIVSEFIG